MTALEVYEFTTRGGATDFARLIRACESFSPYCLIVARNGEADVLGMGVKIASLEDVTQGKLWAHGDPRRQLSGA
jgi:hypothetical protein